MSPRLIEVAERFKIRHALTQERQFLLQWAGKGSRISHEECSCPEQQAPTRGTIST